MASKKPKAAKTSTGKKARAPFSERVEKRILKFGEWAEKIIPRFSSAPKSDVPDALTEIVSTLATTVEDLKKLNGWSPPTRSPSFAVGDMVAFKPAKLDELVAAGLYTKSDLAGEHEILAIAGRKVKLEAGLFQNLYVTKAA